MAFQKIKVLILFFILFLSGCIKKSLTLQDLPPATTIGANTFGCLIDGTGFEPLQFYYLGFTKVYSNDSLPNTKKFFIGGLNSIQSPNRTLNLSASGIVFHAGDQIPIQTAQIKHAVSAVYYLYGTGFQQTQVVDIFKSTNSSSNILSISKLDTLHRILSGTFSFDMVDSLGKVSQIREGRFEILY